MIKHHKKSKQKIKFVALYVTAVFLISIAFVSFFSEKGFIFNLSNRNIEKFIPPITKAESVYVYDTTSNKVLYKKNESSSSQLASLTKIMTAVVSMEELLPFQEVTISGSTVVTPDYLQNSYGEKWGRDELIRFMLFVSSNTAANALNLEATNQNKGLIFLMNKKAKSLNLDSLSFSNPSGLDNSIASGSYGTAKDVAKLFEYAISKYPNLFEPTKYKEYNFISTGGNNYFATNTNEVVDKIPGIYASKTGFTNLAGGNLAVALEVNKHKVIIVILGSEKEARFTDMVALVDETIKVLK